MVRLPFLIFFLRITAQKLPPLLMVGLFSLDLQPSVIMLLTLTRLLLGGGVILLSRDWRTLLAAASVSNNVWLILALAVRVEFILMFLMTYSFFLLLLVSASKALEGLQFLRFVAISGLPPFPLFFFKVSVILTLRGVRALWVIFLLILRALPLTAYISSSFFVVRSRWARGRAV